MSIWERLSRRLGELSEEFLPDDLRDRVEGARELLERGETGTAIAALEQVVRAKPGHATALYLLGVAHLRRGDLEPAARTFAAAAEARAGFGEAHLGLGEARLRQDDAPGALASFRDALDRAGGDRDLLADAYRGLGRAHLALGDRDRALRELRKALVEDATDADAAIALAEALLADPGAEPAEAREPLERVCRRAEERHVAPPPTALAMLGRVELRAGRHAVAERALERALGDGGLPPARVADALADLADVALARGDAPAAHERLLRALEPAPARADLHARIGDAHLAARNVDAALDAYERALALGAGPQVAARALSASRAASDPGRAARLAERLLALAPEHALALAVRGAALVAAGELDAAREALGRALGAGETVEARAALARLELAAGAPDRAAAEAERALALSPTDTGARDLLRAARLAAAGAADAPGDLYALATRVHAASLGFRELAELTPEAARTITAYDRPLVVTVMGEFSSGKSTFVNAFLGADVAPVGITPTTATINVLTYGREPAGRIVYRDDTSRELAWEHVPRVLRAVDPAEAARIRHVEVLYPAEALQRVNIVDTPGLNSILPEHEAAARRFVAEADAVVWLFAIGQAGKATERQALEQIRAEGKTVLGVVNKIDQASPSDVARVLAELEEGLGDLVVALVPVSARRALAARQASDPAALAASSWSALEAALEERFFQQARRLKREACARRLGALLREARARAVAAGDRDAARTAALTTAAAAARADATILTRGVVAEERRALAERFAGTYRAAAREVLELVRPRKLPFGTHQAARADRDYLLGLLERGLAAALDPTRRRVAAELERAGRDARAAAAAAGASGDEAALGMQVQDALALVDARVFDRFGAYLRGYLRGGHLDDFFARVLPRLELTEDAVYHALYRDAPDVDAEVAEPLVAHGDAALRALAARLDRLAERADLERFHAEDVLGALVDRFEQARVALAGGGA